MMWAYYEAGFDNRYEIDGDYHSFKLMRYGLASLIANPSKIVYFPIRGEGFGGYFYPNYDAVIIRPELQLRHSEWRDLRHQLNDAHRIKRFELYYDADKLCRCWDMQMEKFWYKYKHMVSKEVSKLEEDTVFFTLSKDFCYSYHSEIFETGKIDKFEDDYSILLYGINGAFGYMITPRSKVALIRDQKKWEQEQHNKQNKRDIPQKCQV